MWRRTTPKSPFWRSTCPKGLDQAKLEALVTEVIAATGATTKKDMGKVIGALKQRPEAALIDFGAASKLVQAKLV